MMSEAFHAQWAHFPNYFAHHVVLTVAALAIGILLSLPLAALALRRPTLAPPLLEPSPHLALLSHSAGTLVANLPRESAPGSLGAPLSQQRPRWVSGIPVGAMKPRSTATLVR